MNETGIDYLEKKLEQSMKARIIYALIMIILGLIIGGLILKVIK
jgi:hypothetical protein